MICNIGDYYFIINDNTQYSWNDNKFLLPFLVEKAKGPTWNISISEFKSNNYQSQRFGEKFLWSWLYNELSNKFNNNRDFNKVACHCKDNTRINRYESSRTIITSYYNKKSLAVNITFPSKSKTLCYLSSNFVEKYSEFLRLIYIELLPLLTNTTMLLHSASIIFGDQGFLFVGTSGAGKTTVCTFAQKKNYCILSDETTMVQIKNDNIFVRGTPWSGSEKKFIGKNKRVRLSGIFKLKKSKNNSISKLKDNKERILLLKKSLINKKKDKLYTVKNVANLIKLSNKIPFYLLFFDKSDTFIDVIKKIIRV